MPHERSTLANAFVAKGGAGAVHDQGAGRAASDGSRVEATLRIFFVENGVGRGDIVTRVCQIRGLGERQLESRA